MLKLRMSADEAEQLEELINSDGFAVLLKKVLPALIEVRRERVFTQDLTEAEAFTKLAILKAEADGGKKLATEIAELKKILKQSRD